MSYSDQRALSADLHRPLTGWMDQQTTAWLKSFRRLRGGQKLPRFHSLDTVCFLSPGCCHPESALHCCQLLGAFSFGTVANPSGVPFFLQDYCRLAPTLASSESAALCSSLPYCYERRFHLTVTPPHPWCDLWTCAQDHSTTSTTSTEQSVRLSSHLLPALFRLKLSAGPRVRNNLSIIPYPNPTAGLKRRLLSF